MDGRLVGALGVFKEAAVGRFQLVCTDPGFQRRGIAGTLVYYASRFALKHMGLRLLVIVATEDSYAAKVYESVGFVPTEKMYGLCCFDKSKYS